MTDLEIIKEKLGYIVGENCEVDEEYDAILDAATRMAAEIERLQDEIKVLRFCIETNGELAQERNEENINQRYEIINLQKENELYYEENARLKAALAEKPEIVRCGVCKHKSYCESLVWFYGDMGNSDYRLTFCSVGTRKEAKDED